MSITFTKSLGAGLVVGNTVTVDFRNQSTGIYLPPTYQQQANNKTATLLIFNESGYGFTFTMGGVSTQSKPLPAGGWRSISLPNDVQTLTLTVVYVLPNAPTNTLIMEFCQAGETPDDTGFLGNSPIGLSAVTLPVTQVIQDGQPNGQTIVEATPTGQPQNVLITTDGTAVLKSTVTVGALALTGGPGGSNVKIDYEGSTFMVVRTPESGGTAQSMVFQVWDGAAGQNAFEVGREASPTSGTNIASTGAISRIAGQATAGSFGVPVIVAQALRVAVTATTLQNILVYAVPADGHYRINADFRVNNGTNFQHVSIAASYTDPDSSTPNAVIFTVTNQSVLVSASAINVDAAADGTNTTFANSSWACSPAVVNAKGGTNITCTYRDPANTPNDVVTFIIERLA